MAETKLAFIGTGNIAHSHLRTLTELGNVAFVGFCDVDKARAEDTAKEFATEAKTYDDWRAMLDELDFDACYVCVPPHVHEDMEVRLAEKGAHIFVEKPVNLYVEDAARARDAIEKAGVISCVGYTFRYAAATDQAVQLFKSHKVAMAHVRRWGGFPGTPWWRVMDQSGGQLHEQVTHQVDLLRALMGEVVEVTARYSLMLKKDVENITVPDVQAALLRFESGALATVTGSCAMEKVYVMEADFIVEGQLVSWKYREGLSVKPEGAMELPPLPDSTPGIHEAFIRAVKENDRSLIKTPYDDGWRSAQVTLAANESAKTGKPVQIEYR